MTEESKKEDKTVAVAKCTPEAKGAESKSAEETDTTTNATKKLKYKKELPSVAYLLQYGAEEDPNAPPETFLQSLVLPGMLLLTFVVSLALFHWGTNGFQGGNKGQRYQQFQKFATQAPEGGEF